MWPFLSDTGRVNRLIGLPPSKRFEPGVSGGRVVHSHYFGVPVTWREEPFEWVFEQWFSVTRVFDAPLPVERVGTTTTLTPLSDQRTQIDVTVHIVPRNILGSAAGWIVVGQKMLRDLQRAYRTLGAAALEARIIPPQRKPSVNREQLAAGAQRLQQFQLSAPLIERLITHLSSADDPDVLRMRPFALADQWNESRDETLRMCLYATRAGLLDMEWEVLCPSCRGITAQKHELADLVDQEHCPACNIRYDVNFDESVELRFSVNSAVRDAYDITFCVGGPANSRHIAAQIRLPPGSEKSLSLRLAAGEYHLRAIESRQSAVLSVTPTATTRNADLRVTAPDTESDAQAVLPGEATLLLHNPLEQPVLAVLEESSWNAQATRASLVTSLEEFRRLFSSEVLAPGLGLAVRNLTFLFSDLKESTAIYDTIGDAPAFARVRDHFDSMRRIISSHNGALVKTIGDAVMAVFSSAEAGLAAAMDIQHEFISGEITRGHPALRVKLGLHCGPCIAVNANNVLDYFGSTVNVAARTQGESTGGDIVVTADMLADAGVQRLIEQSDFASETFDRTLRGMQQQFTLCRLWSSERAQLRRSEHEQQADEVVVT